TARHQRQARKAVWPSNPGTHTVSAGDRPPCWRETESHPPDVGEEYRREAERVKRELLERQERVPSGAPQAMPPAAHIVAWNENAQRGVEVGESQKRAPQEQVEDKPHWHEERQCQEARAALIRGPGTSPYPD